MSDVGKKDKYLYDKLFVEKYLTFEKYSGVILIGYVTFNNVNDILKNELKDYIMKLDEDKAEKLMHFISGDISLKPINIEEILFYYPMLIYSMPQEAALNTLIYSK